MVHPTFPSTFKSVLPPFKKKSQEDKHITFFLDFVNINLLRMSEFSGKNVIVCSERLVGQGGVGGTCVQTEWRPRDDKKSVVF